MTHRPLLRVIEPISVQKEARTAVVDRITPTSSNAVIHNISGFNAPVGVTMSHDGAFAYVINSGDGSVSVIDTSDYSVVSTMPVGNLPMGAAVSADGNTIYIANSNSAIVSVITITPSG